MRLVVTLLIACFAACFSVEAQAQDFVGTRALSLGESYRAIATGNDAIYLNPAGLPLLKRYAIEAHYLMNLVDEKQAGHVSVVDARTLPLATGLAYSFQGNDFSRRTTWEHTATLAFG